MSNVFGGDSYSPMHTPSPMHGNPLTPGAGLGPMSPAYTPQTPMTQFDEGKLLLNLIRSLVTRYEAGMLSTKSIREKFRIRDPSIGNVIKFQPPHNEQENFFHPQKFHNKLSPARSNLLELLPSPVWEKIKK